MLYDDGTITPAISVPSAAEGIRLIAPAFAPCVLLATVGILGAFFMAQKHGTARAGAFFGPIILVWLAVMAATGRSAVLGHPASWRRSTPGKRARSCRPTFCKGSSCWGSFFWW